MQFQTTTFAGRNVGLLETAAAMLPERDGEGPVRILEAGPGLAVRWLGRRARLGAPARGFFKAVETAVRRLPLPDSWYENYESEEIFAAFGRERVSLTVLDINPGSLRIIARNLRSHGIATLEADLGDPALAERVGPRFDVAVALATVNRVPVERRGVAAANLIALTRPGGLIVENSVDLTAHGPAEPTGVRHIYRRL